MEDIFKGIDKSKGFLTDDDDNDEEKAKQNFNELYDRNDDLSKEDSEKMLKELEAQGKKFIRKINEKFDEWYGANKDYLMREYIGEHQKEFREFCGKIFMEEDEKEESDKEELNEKDIKISED